MFLRFMWNCSAHIRRCQNIYQLEESELKQFSFKQIQEKVKNLGKKNTTQIGSTKKLISRANNCHYGVKSHQRIIFFLIIFFRYRRKTNLDIPALWLASVPYLNVISKVSYLVCKKINLKDSIIKLVSKE